MLNRIKNLSRRVILWISIPVMVLLAARIAAPYVIRHAINTRLSQVEGYSGRVENVNIRLFRGAYQLREVTVLKQEATGLEPLLAVDTIDFSLAWRELLRGRIVSDIALIVPELRITTATPPENAKDDGRRWQDAINDIFPIEITRFEIMRGSIRFIDETSSPRVDISLYQLELVATGLRNRPTTDEASPARLHAEALTTGEGRLTLMIDGDPLAARPHFNLKLDWQYIHLPAFNDFLEAYANVDVSAGLLKIYAEISAREGGFEGYVKPFFEGLTFENLHDANKNFARRVWEKIVSGTAAIMENDERQQVATRIPFSGRFGETDVGIWATIGGLIRNGFIRALNEGRESESLAKTD